LPEEFCPVSRPLPAGSVFGAEKCPSFALPSQQNADYAGTALPVFGVMHR
jgi:hypothetical protein